MSERGEKTFTALLYALFALLILCAILFLGSVGFGVVRYTIAHPLELLRSVGTVVGVFACFIVIIFLLQVAERRLPRTYASLAAVGSVAVVGLICFIVLGGMLRACKNPDRCTTGEARYGGC